MTSHSAIVGAVVAQLKAASAVADGHIYRGRRRPIAEGISQAVAVRFGGSTPSRTAIRGAPVDWTTTVIVECYARAAATQSADEAALALHADVYARLFSDPSLGGLAGDMTPPRVDVDEEEHEESIGCLIAAYEVQHRTSANTIT